MIVPNKALSLDESALGLSSYILGVGPESFLIEDLWGEVKHNFPSIDHFIIALDVLYVLNKVKIINGEIIHVS